VIMPSIRSSLESRGDDRHRQLPIPEHLDIWLLKREKAASDRLRHGRRLREDGARERGRDTGSARRVVLVHYSPEMTRVQR
jgi:hypothetical protein